MVNNIKLDQCNNCSQISCKGGHQVTVAEFCVGLKVVVNNSYGGWCGDCTGNRGTIQGWPPLGALPPWDVHQELAPEEPLDDSRRSWTTSGNLGRLKTAPQDLGTCRTTFHSKGGCWPSFSSMAWRTPGRAGRPCRCGRRPRRCGLY